jgi:hypothetical protein
MPSVVIAADTAGTLLSAVAGGAELEELVSTYQRRGRPHIGPPAAERPAGVRLGRSQVLVDLASEAVPHRRTGRWPPGGAPDTRRTHEPRPTSGLSVTTRACSPTAGQGATWRLIQLAVHSARIFSLRTAASTEVWSMEGRRYRALERKSPTRQARSSSAVCSTPTIPTSQPRSG